jgi:nitrate reductase NapE component
VGKEKGDTGERKEGRKRRKGVEMKKLNVCLVYIPILAVALVP